MDKIVEHENTEYPSHAFTEVVDGENRNEWILVKR